MPTYFNIRYEFNQESVHNCIARQLQTDTADYICVADGVILNIANRKSDYLAVINGGMFSICDSSYVPLYIRWIYGKQYKQYCGSQIFMDIIRSRKYRMIFMGTSQNTLNGLKNNLLKEDGLFVLEHGKQNNFEDHPHFVERRVYGSVNFSFFK